MKNTVKLIVLMIFVTLNSLALSACGASKTELTPTIDVAAVQTAAVSTFMTGLTQTAFAMPTDTPTYTPTATSAVTNTPIAIGNGTVPTTACYGLVLVRDVTIPDNAPMNPGETFTKTWLVKNSGTCTWDTDFKFVFTSGDSMSGAGLILDEPVSSGAEVELSIAMKAPSKAGTLRGHWRMSTKSGTLFGDDLFVAIVVGNSTSTATGAAATGTATDTATPTETPTP
jgi:hypothetical protein